MPLHLRPSQAWPTGGSASCTNAPQQLGANFDLKAFHDEILSGIRRYWTVKDGAKVLKWARSRPTYDQRARALVGVAEAFEHGNSAG